MTVEGGSRVRARVPRADDDLSTYSPCLPLGVLHSQPILITGLVHREGTWPESGTIGASPLDLPLGRKEVRVEMR